MQPKNGLCVSLFRRFHFSVDCILAAVYNRDRVLCTHTLSHLGLDRIRVFRWPNTHTHSPKWRGCFFRARRFAQKEWKREHYTKTRLFSGNGAFLFFFLFSMCLLIYSPHCSTSKYKCDPVWVYATFICMHIYICCVVLLILLLVDILFFHFSTFFPYYFCQTLKFAHNYILNNLNRQREKSNEQLEKFKHAHVWDERVLHGTVHIYIRKYRCTMSIGCRCYCSSLSCVSLVDSSRAQPNIVVDGVHLIVCVCISFKYDRQNTVKEEKNLIILLTKWNIEKKKIGNVCALMWLCRRNSKRKRLKEEHCIRCAMN